MIAIDGEVIAAIRMIATIATPVILTWMIAMIVLVLRKRKEAEINGKR